MKYEESICTICGAKTIVKTDENGKVEVVNADKEAIKYLEEEVRELEDENRLLKDIYDKGAD